MPPLPSSLRGLAIGAGLVLAQAVSPGSAVAQSWPQQSLWQMNVSRFNPAASSNLYSLEAVGDLRRQWVNIEGAPSTTGLTLAAPVYIVGGGASLGVERDVIGAHEATTVRGGLSYKVFGNDELAVSVGAGVTWRTAALDGRALRTPDGTYEGIGVEHADPVLSSEALRSSALGADVGVEATYRESAFGVAVVNALEPRVAWGSLDHTFARSVLVYATTVLPIAELIDLELAGIGQTDAAVWQAQAGAMAWYNSNIGFGASFRGYSASTVDAVVAQVGWRPSASLAFAYAYDYGLSGLATGHDGSHELVLRYTMATPIGKGKLPPIIFNPRL